MNTGFVLSRHGSFREIIDKMGGDESFMLELFVIKKYAEKSDKVFVFSHDNENFERILPNNAVHVRFYNRLFYSLFGWIFIFYYVLRYRLDVLYAESISAMIPVLFLNKITKAVVLLDYLYLWYEPMESGFKRTFVKKFECFLIKFADYFVVANKSIRSFVNDDAKILDVNANALLLDSFRYVVPDKNLSCIKGKKILFVGRLIKVKDPLTLIKAHRILLNNFPDVHLIICGDGGLRDVCEKEAGSNVHFLGFAKNIPAIMAACDIFVLPSLFDASPRALVEAMGTGLPCIATDVGGVSGYLDNDCGILIEPKDEKILAQKIDYLLSNPSKAKELGYLARKKIFTDYDLEKNIIKEINFLIDKI